MTAEMEGMIKEGRREEEEGYGGASSTAQPVISEATRSTRNDVTEIVDHNGRNEQVTFPGRHAPRVPARRNAAKFQLYDLSS